MKKHKWMNLNSKQKRCYVCNCIMTKTLTKEKTLVTYQYDNSSEITGNKGCVEKQEFI